MRFLFIIAAILLSPALCFSATIYVPGDHSTIQDAINAAQTGDEIIVDAGTYIENIDYMGKAITLTGEHGAHFTIIDGNLSGSAASFLNGEGRDSVLDGFCLTNGSAPFGGGINCVGSSPTIINCLVRFNESDVSGGGISCVDSDPEITYCSIMGNTTSKYGGAIYCDNSSPWILCGGIKNNETLDPKEGCGGGIACIEGSAPVITNLTFYDNRASRSGGALFCMSGASPTVTNSILAEDLAPKGSEICVGNTANPSSLTISFSCIKGGRPMVVRSPGCTITQGKGMIDDDPLFVEPEHHDLHLQADSPCRNAGDNNAPGITEEDIEEDPRIANDRVDMGGDEFHLHLYHLRKIIPGDLIHIRIVGEPLTPRVTLLMDRDMIDPPKPTVFGDLYLVLPADWRSGIGSIPANGVLIYPMNVPTYWVSGEEYYFQALAGKLFSSRTKLTNLHILRVE